MGVGLGWGIIGLKRKQLDVIARRATDEAATERAQKATGAASSRAREDRDRCGYQTAAQIEALRSIRDARLKEFA